MIRIISWNSSYMGDPMKKVEALQSIISKTNNSHPYVICLQEVTEKSYSYLSKVKEFNNHIFSLNIRKPGKLEGQNRKLGCMVIISEELKFNNSFLINRSLFPERALVAEIIYEEKTFQAISFHSLTGVGYKKAKSANFATIADYLNSRKERPTILCCDLNEPKIDHIDINSNVYFNQGGDKGKYAELILNPKGIHNLRDSFRIWISEPDFTRIQEWQESTDEIEYSPLILSHKVRNTYSKRYDYIMVSPEFKVKSIDYDYDAGVAGGSDHAILIGEYEFNK